MLPQNLRFHFRAHPEFFDESRWINLPGSKNDSLLRSLSFRVQSKDESGLRWALVVSKKAGNAVERSKIKRLVRSAIIALFHSHPEYFDPSYNVVVFVRGKIASQSDAETVILSFLSTLQSSAPAQEKE